MLERSKYLLFFSLALVSAFFTYRTFFMFRSEAMLGVSTVFANTAILMVIWFLGFTAKNDFIQENRFLLIAIPLSAIHVSNIALHLQTSGTNGVGLVLYILSSSSLVFFSYLSGVQENKI